MVTAAVMTVTAAATHIGAAAGRLEPDEDDKIKWPDVLLVEPMRMKKIRGEQLEVGAERRRQGGKNPVWKYSTPEDWKFCNSPSSH